MLLTDLLSEINELRFPQLVNSKDRCSLKCKIYDRPLIFGDKRTAARSILDILVSLLLREDFIV